MDRVWDRCSPESSDAVSVMSGPALMACPPRALQRPWSHQQPVTSHSPMHGHNNIPARCMSAPDITHSRLVLTPGDLTITQGNRCRWWIPKAPGYLFAVENTHACYRGKVWESHSTCFHASGVVSRIGGLCFPMAPLFVQFLMAVKMCQNKLQLLIIAQIASFLIAPTFYFCFLKWHPPTLALYYPNTI